MNLGLPYYINQEKLLKNVGVVPNFMYHMNALVRMLFCAADQHITTHIIIQREYYFITPAGTVIEHAETAVAVAKICLVD